MCKIPESDFIEERKSRMNGIEEAIHFFSNNCKEQRESWVVRHFLLQLHIEFLDNEILPSPDEPIDVVFNEAKFQIKEIYDKGRKRGDEFKESLRKAETATSYSDFFEDYSPQKITCDEVACKVAECASKWQQKYGPSECLSTDLLFYFNLQDVHIITDELTDVNTYSSLMVAWRSVSVYSDDCAFVLHVSEKTPGFLKTAKGKVYRTPTFR